MFKIQVVITLEADFENGTIVDIPAAECQADDLPETLRVDDTETFGELVEFRAAAESVIPQEIGNDPAELFTCHGDHIDAVVVRESFPQTAEFNDRSQRLSADAPGSQEHDIDAETVPQDIREKISELSLLISPGMGQLTAEPRDDAVIFAVDDAFVIHDEIFKSRIVRTVRAVDGNAFPPPCIDAVVVRIDVDIEPADEIRPGPGLSDQDIIDDDRFGHKCVGVSAQNDIDAPGRIQAGGQFFVLIEADVRQKDRKVDIDPVVGVADAADLLDGISEIEERTDQRFFFGLIQNGFRDDPDKENLHAVDLKDRAG